MSNYPIAPASRGWLTYDGGDAGIAVAVRFDRFDAYDRRPGYEWIVATGGTVLAAGDDFRGGCDAEPDLAAMLRTLVAFLASDIESYEYAARRTAEPDHRADGDRFAFPPALLALLAQTDTVAMLELDLAELDR